MTEDRRRQLQAMITWRTVTGTDLANCNIESGGGLNDDEIFPRNAVGQLFNHYYKINDESEIMAFAGLIESYMRRDEYYCLFYGKQFRKILTYLRRKGRTVRARSLLQGYLFSLGVLCDDEGETISVGSFTGGHDSHSFQVTFFAEYVKVLIKDGDVETARRLMGEGIESGGLREDAVIMLRKISDAVEKRKHRYKFPTLSVKKTGLDPEHLAHATIERIALAMLKDDLGRQGVVAEVDVWRLIPQVLNMELREEELRAEYLAIAGVPPADSFWEFLIQNRELLSRAMESTIGATGGQIGYPDLILYDEGTLSDPLFVEVKDTADRLRPHQEAVLNRFVAAGIPCALLKFA